jgi:acyl-CoA synthetase (AMP-forming)/AMP-acid ligase II
MAACTKSTTICGKLVQGNPRTLVDLLQWHAASTSATSPAEAANSPATSISSGFTWIDDSGNVARKLAYADLEREARVVAQGLLASKAHGQRVLLIFEPGLDFVVGFFGCVYAGAIAVPVYPPLKDEDFFKVRALLSSPPLLPSPPLSAPVPQERVLAGARAISSSSSGAVLAWLAAKGRYFLSFR